MANKLKEESLQDGGFRLRPVRTDDEGFLFRVYSSTREDEISELPWDDHQRNSFMQMQFAAQRADYSRRFPDGEHMIIVLGDQRAGRLYLARSNDEIRILDIALLPEYRNKGIGKSIIEGLTREASETNRPVRIYVELNNRALNLFEYNGFMVVQDIGTHLLLEWRAHS
ncbi:MAG TPA: GNAT family N-acetyltransferase [Blastocatellia bacterium]|nr:GNAT family N-acetyltransferase [Blastocatellia bacterium]